MLSICKSECPQPIPKRLRQMEMLLKLPNLQGLLNMDYVGDTLLDLQSSDESEQVLVCFPLICARKFAKDNPSFTSFTEANLSALYASLDAPDPLKSPCFRCILSAMQRAALASRLTRLSLTFHATLYASHHDYANLAEEWFNIRALTLTGHPSKFKACVAMLTPLAASLQCLQVGCVPDIALGIVRCMSSRPVR